MNKIFPLNEHAAEHDTQAAADIQSALGTVACESRGLTALTTALSGPLGYAFSAAVDRIAATTGRIIVTGVGKSGHIALKVAATLTSTGRAAFFVHPSDASHGDLGRIRADDTVLAFSWSGESAELSDIVAHSRRFAVALIACTAAEGSTLSRAADIALVLPHSDEACPNALAPTTSSIMQLAIGDALAVALIQREGFSPEDFHHLHPGGQLGARLTKVRSLMHTGDEVPTVNEAASLSGAIVRMTAGRFGVTGVLSPNGRLVGILTDGDLRRAFARGFTDRPVHEVMSHAPRTISADALAETALAEMNAGSITTLFVVDDDNRPVGVLHIHDLLRAGLL